MGGGDQRAEQQLGHRDRDQQQLHQGPGLRDLRDQPLRDRGLPGEQRHGDAEPRARRGALLHQHLERDRGDQRLRAQHADRAERGARHRALRQRGERLQHQQQLLAEPRPRGVSGGRRQPDHPEQRVLQLHPGLGDPALRRGGDGGAEPPDREQHLRGGQSQQGRPDHHRHRGAGAGDHQ